MSVAFRSLVGSAVLASLLGCASLPYEGSSRSARTNSGSSGMVFGPEHFQQRAGTVLSILGGRLTGIQIRRSAGPCPEITMRGVKSMLGENNPAVYVDGTRTTNTCVLEHLDPAEVLRVEVYPMGVAPRPPYRGHPNGLILVFLQDGRS
jgi:hypothetical protein